MPRAAKPLTVARIRNAKPREFPLWDGRGLHLVERGGRYYWRWKYNRPDGRENRLALGVYPDVSLADARGAAEAARRLLREGTDPGAKRIAEKIEERRKVTETFDRFARQWLALKKPGWAVETYRKQELVCRAYLIPALGARDVRDVTSRDVIAVLRKMDAKAPALTRKAARAAQAIIRMAITEGARDEGHALDLSLRDNLPAQRKGHYAAATKRDDVAFVVRTIEALPNEVTRSALMLCAYTAQRPGNVAAMRWADLDVKGSEWIIPGDAMKGRQPHVVPLSRQALAQIDAMRRFTAGGEFVFPPLARQHTPHLHRDSLSKALRDAGLRGKQTPHGLRATLRTVARERLGVSADVLEAQLAHAKKGEVQAAYDRAGFVAERAKVMQAWADYLDGVSISETP